MEKRVGYPFMLPAATDGNRRNSNILHCYKQYYYMICLYSHSSGKEHRRRPLTSASGCWDPKRLWAKRARLMKATPTDISFKVPPRIRKYMATLRDSVILASHKADDVPKPLGPLLHGTKTHSYYFWLFLFVASFYITLGNIWLYSPQPDNAN